MVENEIAVAWFKAAKELKAIELEIAGLESELKRTGQSLVETGRTLVSKPDMGWNIISDSLIEDIAKIRERAQRYSDLLGRRADKRCEVESFENAS
ncbi:MAG: hypothetical protein WBE76_27485 [Terracidiphilus sp.]